MPAPKLIAIAAMASNRVIGRDGTLPWHLPEDLKFFKQTTLGHPVLMGRKTFDSIVDRLGKPLPGRTNIVLSRNMPAREDAVVIREIKELEQMSDLGSTVYLIGGAQLYETLLSECDELLLTCLDKDHEGDAWFPPFELLFSETYEVVQSGEGYEIRRYFRS